MELRHTASKNAQCRPEPISTTCCRNRSVHTHAHFLKNLNSAALLPHQSMLTEMGFTPLIATGKTRCLLNSASPAVQNMLSPGGMSWWVTPTKEFILAIRGLDHL